MLGDTTDEDDGCTVTRPLNMIEGIFVQLNMRLAVAVSLGHPHTDYRKPDVMRTLAAALRGHVLGGLTTTQSELCRGAGTDATDDALLSSWAFRTQPQGPQDLDLHAALHKALALPAEATGGPTATLVLVGVDLVTAVVLNVNHALCDGRAMIDFVQRFTRALCGEAVEPAPCGALQTPAVDFGSLVEGVKVPATDWTHDYIASFGPERSARILRVGEIIPAAPAAGPSGPQPDACASVPWTRVASTVQSVRARAPPGATPTLNGVFLAAWWIALREAYAGSTVAKEGPGADESGKPVVPLGALSVLVDLRTRCPVVADAPADWQRWVNNCFGTVNVVYPLDEPLDNDDLAALAVRMTADVRERIDRGDALRQAQALFAGRDSLSAPSASIEVSNQGRYQLPGLPASGPATGDGDARGFSGLRAFDVRLAQQALAYDGVSVLGFSMESGENHAFHIAANLGAGVDGARVAAMVRRVAALLAGDGLP